MNDDDSGVLEILEICGGLSNGYWFGDDDTMFYLQRYGYIDNECQPTDKLKAIVPGIIMFVCNGPGVHYG